MNKAKVMKKNMKFIKMSRDKKLNFLCGWLECIGREKKVLDTAPKQLFTDISKTRLTKN